MKQSRRQFLASGVAAGLTAGCHGRPPVFGTLEERGATDSLLLAARANPTNSLSILTWNIFMMPPWIHESPRNAPRAAAIAAELLSRDFDILCLEKAFDGDARDVLTAALGDRYPYRFGPANDSCLLAENSGVWVLSRVPLVNYAQIRFDDCANVECFSEKGAILLTGALGSSPFHLIATHLQGEEGSSFTRSHQEVRNRQMVQIRDELVKPNVAPSTPFFICGDFGTPRYHGESSLETEGYLHMLRTLDAENSPETRITYDDEIENNTLAPSNTGTKAELDYILVRKSDCDLDVVRSRHVFRRTGWDAPTNRPDLSYRYAVSARIAVRGDARTDGGASGGAPP